MPVFLGFIQSGLPDILICCHDLISQPTGTSWYLPCVHVALYTSQNRLRLCRGHKYPPNLSG